MSDKHSRKPLVLVDGSSYLFRAFYGLPNTLTSPDGMQTNAIHGVLNMLDSLRKTYEPEHMAVIFDAKGKTFRNDLYPEYKATRPPMPDDLRCQIEPLHEMILAQGYPMLVESGVEADDVIGTLSTHYEGDVIISTGDKDMAQLVNERVSLINTMSNSFHDVQGVIDKYGVKPDQIRDYLALMGDKVDNVPGVDKVGPKTAVKWLAEYGTLQGVMDNADAIKGKIGENLRDALPRLPLSYELVTIKCDLDLNSEPGAFAFSKENTERLVELYQQYGFRTRLSRLQENNPEAAAAVQAASGADDDVPAVEEISEVDYQCILTQEQLDDWHSRLKEAKLFSFDTETTSLDYMEAQVVGLCFCIEPGVAAYLPLAHDYEEAPQQLDRDATLALLKPLLEDPTRLKVGQNLKYDRSVLMNHGIELKGIVHDTMLESYVLDSVASRHDMDTLCAKHLNHSTIKFEDVAGKGKKQVTFDKVALEEATNYAAEDADLTLRLHRFFGPQLKRQASDTPNQQRLYQRIEMPLLKVLSDIERTGVLIDPDMLAEQSKELAVRMVELEEEIYKEAGEQFNLGSPKQIQAIFFDENKLNLPVIRKTPKGQPSTAEDVLHELAMSHDVPRLLLEHRGLSKLKSTYTDKLPLQINARSGRVHTSYQQAVAATGRLSSTDPNLQNIPVRNAE